MGGKGSNPQDFINCTEGGILGAYPNGNIRQIKQATLAETLFTYTMHEKMGDFMKEMDKKKVLLF
jgi:predicted ATPase